MLDFVECCCGDLLAHVRDYGCLLRFKAVRDNTKQFVLNGSKGDDWEEELFMKSAVHGSEKTNEMLERREAVQRLAEELSAGIVPSREELMARFCVIPEDDDSNASPFLGRANGDRGSMRVVDADA